MSFNLTRWLQVPARLDGRDESLWAAYVLGHHPHTLQIHQGRLWTRVELTRWTLPRAWARLRDKLDVRKALEAILDGIAEMELAVAVLVPEQVLKASAQVQLGKYLDNLRRTCEEIARLSELNPPHRYAASQLRRRPAQVIPFSEPLPCLGDFWKEFACLSCRTLEPWDDTKHVSLRLGQAIGLCRLMQENAGQELVSTRYEELTYFTSECKQSGYYLSCEQALTCAQRVASTSPRPLYQWEISEYTPWPSYQEIDFAFLDETVQHAFRNRPVGVRPEPVLVFDKEQIIFFGEVIQLRPLSLSTKRGFAILCILAEAGKPVGREAIIEQADLDTEPIRLPEIISRFRSTTLKPKIALARKRMDIKAYSGLDECFIHGCDGEEWGSGTYELTLQSGESLVKARPYYMKPRTKPQ